MRVACIIPTYNGVLDLDRLLNSLQLQVALFEVFIVDSSSTDGTQDLAVQRVAHVTVIPPSEFNHGGTRQRMVEINREFDIYVFLTQDACLVGKDAISRLIRPFSDPRVAAVCGRQLPHQDAGLFAQHARLFNYPEGGEVKSISDVPRLGIKTAFMSNSFAAYRAEALNEVGGFPSHVILCEDMFVTAKMLLAGWKIAYAGDAVCRHSHDYSLSEEFRRYFDIGVFHAREPWVRAEFGGAGGEGMKYIRSELLFLGLRHLYLWPGSLFRNMLKLLGYKLGQLESRLPITIKRKLSMHWRYWK